MNTPTTAQTADDFLKSGFEHLEQQDYDRAVADFEAALSIMPDDTLAKSGIETVMRRKNEERGNCKTACIGCL